MKFPNKTQTTIVEWTESCVRFLRAERAGDVVRVVEEQEKEIPIFSEEAAGEAVAKFFSSGKKKSGDLIAVIPRRQMILKHLWFFAPLIVNSKEWSSARLFRNSLGPEMRSFGIIWF